MMARAQDVPVPKSIRLATMLTVRENRQEFADFLILAMDRVRDASLTSPLVSRSRGSSFSLPDCSTFASTKLRLESPADSADLYESSRTAGRR